MQLAELVKVSLIINYLHIILTLLGLNIHSWLVQTTQVISKGKIHYHLFVFNANTFRNKHSILFQLTKV